MCVRSEFCGASGTHIASALMTVPWFALLAGPVLLWNWALFAMKTNHEVKLLPG